LSFENLVLVAKNYVKHGFKSVIITDLNNDFIAQLPGIFKDYDFAIYTLRVLNEELLKSRVLDELRSSGYRDWEKALEINNELKNREPLKNETFIDIATQSVEQVVEQICAKLDN
jgi:hypothetical protein